MATTYIPIATQTTTSAVSTITFDSITSGFTDLILVNTWTATTSTAFLFYQFKRLNYQLPCTEYSDDHKNRNDYPAIYQ